MTVAERFEALACGASYAGSIPVRHPTNMNKQHPKNGYWVEIMPLTFGRSRIIVTDGHLVDDGW